VLATLGIGVAVAGCSNAGRVADSGTLAPRQTSAAGPLLAEVAEQIALPARTWTASGAHGQGI
jgi:hypothetical protein